jgi:hypothetical protein
MLLRVHYIHETWSTGCTRGVGHFTCFAGKIKIIYKKENDLLQDCMGKHKGKEMYTTDKKLVLK